MTTLLTLSRQTSVRLAEVGFLLIVIAGVWIVFAEIPAMRKWHTFRMIVAGVLLAVSGVLLIIASHYGQFG
jgi:hypothetical protein